MKFVRLLCAITAFSGLAGAGVISGTVVEASNNEPVRKAIVTLTLQGTPTQWATERTDSSDAFRFEALPSGAYDLRATKGNAGTAVGEIFMLGDGETRAGVTLRFRHSSTISGRVVDPEGDPVPEVRMSLLKPGMVDYLFASSDERGEYKFSGVAPGQYYVHASQLMELAGSHPLTAQFSTILNVRGGENLAGVDFQMTSEPTVQIHGHVTGSFGATGRVTVQISPADEYVANWWSAPLRLRVQGPDITFTFDARQGRYRIDARVEGDGNTWSASRFVDTHEQPGEIILTLAPARDIKGKLRIEGSGGPLPGSLEVRLSEGRYRPITSVRPAADGSFTIPQVASGTWNVNVNPLPSGAFIKSAQFGDRDVLSKPIEVTPGSEELMSIVISTNTAQIHGKVDARAGILLSGSLYYDVTTDDDGKFELKGIAPGKYKLFALEKMSAADFKSPEAAAKLGPLGEEIELAEGASVEVHPKIIPVEQARGGLP